MTLLGLDRRDLKFAAVTWAVVLAVLVPFYAAGYLSVPPGWTFSGVFIDSHDAFHAQGYANYHAHQGLLIDNPWALEKRPPGFFGLSYFLPSLLLRLGIPYRAAFHFGQLVTGIGMLLAILALMRQLIRDRVMAWCATLLAAYGSGLGWVVACFSLSYFGGRFFPVDIQLGASFPVLALLTEPHLALANVLLPLVYLFAYLATTRPRPLWTAALAATTLTLGFVHPYQFVSTGCVLGAWYLLLLAKHGKPFLPRFVNLVAMLAAMLPAAYFYATLPARNPNFAQYAAPANRTPGPLNVVIGYGLIGLLAVLAHRGILPAKRFSDRYLLVAVWPLVNLPLHFTFPLIVWEAYLGAGLILPLAVLATWAFFGHVVPLLRRAPVVPVPEADVREADDDAGAPADPTPGRLRWAVGLLLLTLPTTGLQMANFMHELRTGQPYFHYTLNTRMKVPKADIEAMERLAGMVRDFPLVLAHPDSGLLLPAFAPVRSFAGFVLATGSRYPAVGEFYGRQTSDAARRAILARNGIDYVWWGRDEDAIGGFRPRELPYLEPVYTNGQVTIFRVNRAAL